MAIMDEVQQLAQSGRPADAIQLVQDRSDAGDAEAMFVLANWRIWGMYGPKDIQQSHSLLERAAGAGWSEAALLLATLINNGTGTDPDPERARSILNDVRQSIPEAAIQLELLDKMTSAETGSWKTRSLREDPVVKVVERLFSSDECDYVRRVAEPLLSPSMIIDPVTGQPAAHPIRISSSANFGPTEEDPVIHALNRRIAVATGTEVATAEPLHILRYTPGQQFRLHHDAIGGAPNQRRWTAIVYLNEDFEGGQTEFPNLGLRVVGKKGDCLIFRNTSEAGDQHEGAWHAGLPVTAGIKWVASRWIREQPYEAEVAAF